MLRNIPSCQHSNGETELESSENALLAYTSANSAPEGGLP